MVNSAPIAVVNSQARAKKKEVILCYLALNATTSREGIEITRRARSPQQITEEDKEITGERARKEITGERASKEITGEQGPHRGSRERTQATTQARI